MECVASGAAIQAGVLSGEVGDIVLVDVTPLTLGVETLGGVATSLIARNTPIPIKHTETFTTAADMQTAVTVHVYQGERPMARDNTSLGEFNLEGLPPAPRGVPKIDVTFDIDANGILNVTARDQATGKEQSIRISGSTRLSDEEKQHMINEAERYAEEDAQRHARAEKLNAADSLCYQAERILADYADKLSVEMRDRLQASLHSTREALQAGDAELAEQRSKELEEVLREAGVALYAQSSEAPKSGAYAPHPYPDTSGAGTAPRPSGAGERGRVVDADYEDDK
jgi:molecular chaperone DnaK